MRQQRHTTIPVKMRMQLINQQNRAVDRLASAPSMKELERGSPVHTNHTNESHLLGRVDFFNTGESPRNSEDERMLSSLVDDQMPIYEDDDNLFMAVKPTMMSVNYKPKPDKIKKMKDGQESCQKFV